jgi:hypothetical protein
MSSVIRQRHLSRFGIVLFLILMIVLLEYVCFFDLQYITLNRRHTDFQSGGRLKGTVLFPLSIVVLIGLKADFACLEKDNYWNLA